MGTVESKAFKSFYFSLYVKFKKLNSYPLLTLFILQKKKSPLSAVIKDLNPSFMFKKPVTSIGLELDIALLETYSL